MLFLAMSCFQGKSQTEAYNNLVELAPDGIQLTPGNWPVESFKNTIKLPCSLHHGFTWDKYKREVYDGNLNPIDIEYHRSIHPPKIKNNINFAAWIEKTGDYIFETMYPGYYLGSGEEIEIAMSFNKRLAVDISHLYIMKFKGVLSDKTIDKILSYDNMKEIHISHNEGKYDTHHPITKNTPFLSAIKSRKVPVVLESYMHNLDFDKRREQVDLARNFL